MLAVLDKAKKPSDMDLPGWRLHPIRGDRKGQWAVEVSGNWRLVFEFDNEDAVGVDLEDYH
jgi:proteic killer suppression protein